MEPPLNPTQHCVETIGFTLRHRLLFILASFAVGIGFLSLALPEPVSLVTFGLALVMVGIWSLVSAPKLQRLKRKLQSGQSHQRAADPVFLFGCAWTAIQPTSAEAAQYPFFRPLFYLALLFPLVCFVIGVIQFEKMP